MADDVIDLTSYLQTPPPTDVPRGSMALWGAEGERSRFALPLWRIIHLARAERGVIAYAAVDRPDVWTPFVVLDLGADPARTEMVSTVVPRFDADENPSLIDYEGGGLIVYLGSADGVLWALVVDGETERSEPLGATAREDVLFLAGECAGLLFLRDLASDVVRDPDKGQDSE